MDDEEIRGRARSGEDSRTELKGVAPGVLPRADDVAKALVAFANSGGGDLIFGVEDSGLITGIGNRSDSDALQRHIGQIAASAVTPPLSPRTLAIEVDGKLVIVAHVPEFLPGRPFRGASKYFIRDGPSSREAQPDELKTLLTSGSNLHYLDEQVVDSASRTDLDDTAIADFLRVAYPAAHAEQTERYLSALQAIDAAGHPTVSGIVLFGSEPTRFLPGAYVSAVRFPGLHASGTFKDRAEVCGNVFSQIEAAVAFLIRHVPTPSSVKGLERVTAGVPLEVWREVITNAVTHRDYASPNQVRVFVFDNRVEITNPGVLLNRLTVESVRLAGTKQPRNPHIASAVARKGQRDNLGIGVPEIFRLLAQQSLPEPQISVDTGEFQLTVFTRA